MNDTVNVTGMRVKTQVSDNLFITSDTLANTATITTDSLYKNSLIGASDAVILEPVSTTDGKAFWYTATNNVKSTGDADSEVYIAYDLTTDTDTTDSFNNDFEANYKVSDAVGYVDYIFQLKAINTSSSASYVILDQLDLTYGSATNASKAFRVAIFAEALTSVNNLTNATTSKTWSGLTSATALIYTPASAENFTAGKAVKTASTLDTVTYVSSAASSKWEVAANTTQYFKFVVRLWLEGEDKTCNNSTFAQLTDEWALDLRFKLTDTAPTVVNINQPTTDAKIDLTGATSAASSTLTIAGTPLYLLKTISGVDYYVTSSTQPAASATNIYVVDSGRLVDVTNQCKLS